MSPIYFYTDQEFGFFAFWFVAKDHHLFLYWPRIHRFYFSIGCYRAQSVVIRTKNSAFLLFDWLLKSPVCCYTDQEFSVFTFWLVAKKPNLLLYWPRIQRFYFWLVAKQPNLLLYRPRIRCLYFWLVAKEPNLLLYWTRIQRFYFLIGC